MGICKNLKKWNEFINHTLTSLKHLSASKIDTKFTILLTYLYTHNQARTRTHIYYIYIYI